MTNDEMRIAIAECCEWKRHHVGATWGWQNIESNTVSARLPNYPNDLNACHEMEKTLSEGELCDYGCELSSLTDASIFEGDVLWGKLAHATARQRCEAFLKVKGRWKE